MSPRLPGSFSIDFLIHLIRKSTENPLSLPGSFSIDILIHLIRKSTENPLSLPGFFSVGFLIILIRKSIQKVSEAVWLLFYWFSY